MPSSMEPLRVLIIEDEALLAMELEGLVEDAGHTVVGWASSSTEAIRIVDTVEADIAFVDVHLTDGPTGIRVAEHIRDSKVSMVVFLTANPLRLPDHFAGAVGVIGKPYTKTGLNGALRFLHEGLRAPPPASMMPSGFTLAPQYRDLWYPAAK